MQPTETKQNSSTASLILGIAAIVTAFTVIIGIVLGILAIIFGVKAAKQPQKGKAITGIITGSLAICISLTMVLFWSVFLAVPALQRNSRDVARQSEVGMLVSRTHTLQANDQGVLPTASMLQLDASGLEQITTITSDGLATTDTAVYKVGITCSGTQASDRAFSISILLESGKEFCQDS